MKNKEVKQLIETNKQIQNFIGYLQSSYEFKDEENDMLNLVTTHFDNLNVIFGKIKK